ncbi:DUF2110 family protein [Candidatus Bathyarchaeota archaeon]|nr:DUF2110 family protein [Candidatus Bathyarchaeota archaeon]
MAVVTLLEKVYGRRSAKEFQRTFAEMCRGLNVKLKVLTCAPRGWIRLEVKGEDERAALNFLKEEVGLAPVSIKNIRRGDIIRGRVISSKSKIELKLDLGVYEPEMIDASVPLRHLQAQLADGKKLALKTIIELYGLYPNLPLEVKVHRLDVESELIEVHLSEWQILLFDRWIRQTLERLIILGVTREEIEYAIKTLRLSRDIYAIESLGLLEHAIICKLGTEARGLIPKLGPKLQNAVLTPFTPTKIQKTIERKTLN